MGLVRCMVQVLSVARYIPCGGRADCFHVGQPLNSKIRWSMIHMWASGFIVRFNYRWSLGFDCKVKKT